MQSQTIRSNESLARVLKTRREELKITQRELAAYCDLSHNGISRIELGESDVKLSTLIKMSKMLGFKVSLEMEE